MSRTRITFSVSSLWLLLGAIILLILIWQLRSLLVTLMIAVVLAATLVPVVDGAERLRIPRWLAVVLVYLGLLSLLMGVGILLGPSVAKQIERLTARLPGYIEDFRAVVKAIITRFGVEEPGLLDQLVNTQALTGWVIRSSQQLILRSLGLTRGIVGGFLSIVLAVLISGYMMAGSRNLIRGLINLFPYPWNQRLEDLVQPVSRRMGGYIQGRIVVSGILGIVITIGLRFAGLSEFALALGVIAGITNLIPFFGPVLGSLPALIVAVAQGGWTFLWVFLLFVVIQNLETYVLDPLLVGSSVNVPPLYQLLAVLGGTQVLGIIGALIVPPWVAGSAVMLENLYLKPKMEAEQQREQEKQESLSEEVVELAPQEQIPSQSGTSPGI